MQSALPALTATLAVGITLIAAAIILPSVFMLEWSIQREDLSPRPFAVLVAAQYVCVLMGCFTVGFAYPSLALPLLALLVGGQVLSKALLRMPSLRTVGDRQEGKA
jgi:hypothetical protein